MGSQKMGIVFLLIGLIIFILALIVDFVGLGQYPGYGYKQISGMIVGAIIIIVGVYFTQKI